MLADNYRNCFNHQSSFRENRDPSIQLNVISMWRRYVSGKMGQLYTSWTGRIKLQYPITPQRLFTLDPKLVFAASQHKWGNDVAKSKNGAVPAGHPLVKQQEKWPKDKIKKKKEGSGCYSESCQTTCPELEMSKTSIFHGLACWHVWQVTLWAMGVSVLGRTLSSSHLHHNEGHESHHMILWV